MAATTITGVFIIIIHAINFSSSSSAAATQAPSSSSPPIPTCTEELVMFSPCLPYVSASPNNLSDTPNPICCSVFSSSVNTTAGKCLCYLLRQPMILGFPLDRSRLFSLSQICTDQNSDQSFESLCSLSETPELPPFQSIQFTNPFVSSGSPVSASPPSVGLPPESVGDSPSSDHFSPEAATESPPPPPILQSISNVSPNRKNLVFVSATIITLAIIIFTPGPPPPPPVLQFISKLLSKSQKLLV